MDDGLDFTAEPAVESVGAPELHQGSFHDLVVNHVVRQLIVMASDAGLSMQATRERRTKFECGRGTNATLRACRRRSR